MGRKRLSSCRKPRSSFTCRVTSANSSRGSRSSSPPRTGSVPTEFGKLVKIQEAEQQIVTHYEVYDERPSDAALLIPALDAHEQQLRRTPRLVTADAAFFSAQNEAAAHARGVKRIAIPKRSTKSAERKKLQKKRWFRKRRHGLNRCQASRP
jgi:IS5 family transposase